MRRDPSVTDPDRMVGYAGNLDPSSPTDLLIAIPGMSSSSFEGNPLDSRDSYEFFLNPCFMVFFLLKRIASCRIRVD